MDAPRKGLTLNADPADQLRLLDIAEQDARLAQLTHRRRTLPEIAEIEQLTGHAETVRDRIVGAETEASDVAREVAKAETDVEQVRARATPRRRAARLRRDHLGQGAGEPAARDRLAGRRQSDLEDIELEILERQEDVNRVLSELRQEAVRPRGAARRSQPAP